MDSTATATATATRALAETADRVAARGFIYTRSRARNSAHDTREQPRSAAAISAQGAAPDLEGVFLVRRCAYFFST